jgi:hypothetical protein
MRNTEDKSSKEVMHKFQERKSKVSSTVTTKSYRASQPIKSSAPKILQKIEEKAPDMEISHQANQKSARPLIKPSSNPPPMKAQPYLAPNKSTVPTKISSTSSSKPQPSMMMKGQVTKPMMKKEVKQPEPEGEEEDEDQEYEILHKAKNINSDF